MRLQTIPLSSTVKNSLRSCPFALQILLPRKTLGYRSLAWIQLRVQGFQDLSEHLKHQYLYFTDQTEMKHEDTHLVSKSRLFLSFSEKKKEEKKDVRCRCVYSI